MTSSHLRPILSHRDLPDLQDLSTDQCAPSSWRVTSLKQFGIGAFVTLNRLRSKATIVFDRNFAKAFGYENWNILSAKIEAAEPATGGERTISVASQNDPAPPKTLYCSFCGKSQHEVNKLIAGPPPVFICDECVDICTDVVEPDDDMELFRLMKANEESGRQADRTLFELARGTSTDELAHYVERSRKGIERSRLALQGIQRKLAMPDDDILTLPRQRDKRREDLVILQQKAQRELKRYEDALSIARTVLGERRQ